MFKKRKKNTQTASRKLVTRDAPKSITLEQFRMIRENINFLSPDKKVKTLLFTSSSSGEGKSTMAANVAIVFAQAGKRVLLVDADMRKPTTHYTFKSTISPGLSHLLTKQRGLDEVIKRTHFKGLELVTCGKMPINPAELLSSKVMEDLIIEMKSKYDIIIIDAPPILLVADAQILSNKCDGTILVVSSGETEKNNAKKAKGLLENSKANVLGVILNNYKLEKDHYYYNYNSAKE
ncbi:MULTISPECIES: CpsD/CapB family tyrosine-protein kinase [Bacillales]|uniref:CpsD/CapB family tyrosine-protein kinase n=1 Tax=Bacillales TaxID=1385 RepID=UPI0029160A1C|nr:CpsD/CapB family tyrosine-protein kinase [Saccharococcus sp. Marseille-Q5394]